MAPFLKQLRGDEKILDIGCGDGKITADLSRFVPNGHVTGIDPTKEMIQWTKKQYHPLEYPNIAFQQGGFLNPRLTDSFDVIVAFCSLQHCVDQELVFRQMYELLTLGGTLLILVPTRQNLAWNQSKTTVQQKEKWVDYWNEFSFRPTCSIQQYEAFFEKAGFGCIQIKSITTKDPFVNQEEIISWLEGTFPPIVPEDKRREFYQEWMEEYVRLYPEAKDSDGVIYAELGYITLKATKR